jgi:lyso-ornithine lipid O-acyltransferase
MTLILAAFVVFTVPLMPVQALFLRCSTRAARWFPHWYHRKVCRILGVHLTIDGAVVRDRPVLVVCNHISWLDIPVLSAVAPVSFVAKKDVSGWPFVSTLARLQRSVYVDRDRPNTVGETASAMLERLAAGDAIVLFPEGTSTDGNRVLAFKSSLFAAVKPTAGQRPDLANAVVQTLSLVYTKRNGLPLTWDERRALGYYGDMTLGDNAFEVLGGGPLHASISISPPIALSDFTDRKDLSRRAEASVRAAFVSALRNGG